MAMEGFTSSRWMKISRWVLSARVAVGSGNSMFDNDREG